MFTLESWIKQIRNANYSGAMDIYWEQDTLADFQSAATEEQLFAMIVKAARAIGFDHCAYGARTPFPITQPRFILHNNYSDAWRSVYAEKNYLSIDPTVQHAFRSTRPLLWSEARFLGAKTLWDDAHDHGLAHGWAQAARDTSGLLGLLTLARSSDNISESELVSSGPRMLWLVQSAHTAMSELIAPSMVPEAQVKLTGRELEVLKWTAEGRTAGEVSSIMNISVNTVQFHVTNLVRKLGAANKMQAAVKAAMCGLLD